MKTDNIVSNKSGFTLIEIVAVLVIMSILAAVAIPKFFNMQERARKKAIYTATSELKTRVNQHFGEQLLDGTALAEITYEQADIGMYLSADFLIENWDYTTDPSIITFDITFYPDPTDHSKNPMTLTGQVLTKPLME